MARARSKSAARKNSSARSSVTRTSATARASGEFVCPECGKSFTRAASLGAHRNRVHGVAGSSTQARARRSVSSRPANSARKSRSATAAPTSTAPKTTAARSTKARKLRTAEVRQRRRSSGAVNRDALLGSLFPNGIPARESVIREANEWLDQAERLAKLA